jgi:hypothetical protein
MLVDSFSQRERLANPDHQGAPLANAVIANLIEPRIGRRANGKALAPGL